MKDRDTNTSLWGIIGLLLFGCLILYGAYLILWEGEIPTRHTNGFHTFNGLERVVGVMPLGFGMLVIWVACQNLYERLQRALSKHQE